MKPYLPENQLPAKGIILLASGSIALGLLTGALAYFISNLIYYIIIFPLIIGCAALVAYQKLLLRIKVRHSIITALFGIVTGLSIAVAFYGTPYLINRKNVVDYLREKYQVDAATASYSFDANLLELTGSGGFIGYMKLRASEGDEYTNYLVINSVPVQTFSFALKSTGAWLYWLLEIILFVVPCAWIGFSTGKTPFNKSADDWYDTSLTQIGSVRLEDKERLFAYLQMNEFSGISQLMAPDGAINHPMLEFYQQRSNNKKGDILLSVKQTFRKNPKTVKRTLLNQWEVPSGEYKSMTGMIESKVAEKNLV
jgi:hypothetical protein